VQIFGRNRLHFVGHHKFFGDPVVVARRGLRQDLRSDPVAHSAITTTAGFNVFRMVWFMVVVPFICSRRFTGTFFPQWLRGATRWVRRSIPISVVKIRVFLGGDDYRTTATSLTIAGCKLSIPRMSVWS
jgi:hypothetical protein